MISPRTRRNILRVIPFGIIWLVFSLVYIQLERGILGNLTYYPATGNPYTFYSTLLITPVAAVLTGLLIGVIEINYFYSLFMKMNFGRKILYKSLAYLILIISFLLATSVIANAIELRSLGAPVWVNVQHFFSSFAFWSVAIYIAAIIIVSQFYTEVSENIGQNVLNNFFTGRYHQPKEEERIFMFLDMKSSTTIAEQLGHVKYFAMLKKYYDDLSDPIIDHGGEIYQYVGDEIIVSWKLSSLLNPSKSIDCFFAMREAIAKQEINYRSAFGVMPGFKAAIHTGRVTTGEIGIIKKEIIFTGDVLNTTARMQSLCNEYQVDILISGQLKEQLFPLPAFCFRALGEQSLRGRGETIELFTIETNKP